MISIFLSTREEKHITKILDYYRKYNTSGQVGAREHVFQQNYKIISLNIVMITKLSFNKMIHSINNSKFFAGLVMIMLNIGSKYITIKLSK